MSYLKRPFFLGNAQFPNNIFYAPLAGCSDFPYRQMGAKYQPGAMFCEMVKMEALVRLDRTTLHMLDYDRNMHPIGGQIVGSNPKIAGIASKIIEDLGFDLVDLNCGCPVDKVTKDGSGSGLLKTPELIAEIVHQMVNAVQIPVTVKIRAGWDEKHIAAPKITQLVEEAGAKLITVHGRTRAQAYRGSANWEHISHCKQVAKTIKVMGNGDLFTKDDVLKMFHETGCDGVVVSRGTMGQPWIVEDIIQALLGELQGEQRENSDFVESLLKHFRYCKNYHSDRRALLEMRKIGCWYLKSSVNTRQFRQSVSHASSLEEIETIITTYRKQACGE